MRNIVVLGLIGLFFTGCAVKTSFHGGRLNVVRVSQEDKIEQRVWNYTVSKFNAKPEQVKQPQTISGKRDFVQQAYEASGGDPKTKVGGFYKRAPAGDDLVVYITGEFSILVHEYCHALNHQLKANLTRQQNEYFCTLMKKEYEGRFDIRTKGSR